MNTYSQSLKSFGKMDKETQIRALYFMNYLISKPYNEFNRCVSEEVFDKNIIEKKKEIQYLQNKLRIKL